MADVWSIPGVLSHRDVFDREVDPDFQDIEKWIQSANATLSLVRDPLDDLVAEIARLPIPDDLDPLVDLIASVPIADPLDDLVNQILVTSEVSAATTLADAIFDFQVRDATDDLVDAIFATPIRRGLNATAKFLDRRIRETGGLAGSLMRILKMAVSKHLPVSCAVGIVEDHIQNCFMRLIARDSLAIRMADGHKITDQQIAMFAVRAGFTDIRDSGTDPVCRELYGARTEREREKGVVLPAISDPRVVWGSVEDGDAAGTWTDIADSSGDQEEAVNFAMIWDRLEAAIRRHKPNAADRYIGILRSKTMGNTVNDIADLENVSPFRAASMMGEIRRVLREEDFYDFAGMNDLY